MPTLALVIGSVLILAALLLVPALLLQRFLRLAHASERREMMACGSAAFGTSRCIWCPTTEAAEQGSALGSRGVRG